MANLGNTNIKGMLNVSGLLNASNVDLGGKFKGPLTGNADTATSAGKLTASRTISLTGNVTGSVSTDLSGNVSIATTVAANSHNHTVDNITGILPIAKGGTGSSTAAGVITNLGVTATVAELNHVKGVTSPIQTQLGNKVDKVTGKQLSTEDYTTVEKNKLAAINQAVATNSNVQFAKVGIGAAPTEALDVNGNAKIRNSNTIKFGGVNLTDSKFEMGYNSSTNSLDIRYIGG